METAQEELIQRFANLLQKDTPQPLNFSPGLADLPTSDAWRLCIIVKLLSDSFSKVASLQEGLFAIWKTQKPFRITEFSNGSLLIRFEEDTDLEKIMRDCPWSFNNNLIAIQMCKPNTPPDQYTFSHCDFWVRFTGLPVEYLTSSVIEKLGEAIGTTQPISDEDALKWGRYARARIQVALAKPLIHRINFSLMNGVSLPVTVQFEKLPCFCGFCGLIGHGVNSCQKHKNFKVLITDDLPAETKRKMLNMLSTRFPLSLRVEPSVRRVMKSTSGNDSPESSDSLWPENNSVTTPIHTEVTSSQHHRELYNTILALPPAPTPAFQGFDTPGFQGFVTPDLHGCNKVSIMESTSSAPSPLPILKMEAIPSIFKLSNYPALDTHEVGDMVVPLSRDKFTHPPQDMISLIQKSKGSTFSTIPMADIITNLDFEAASNQSKAPVFSSTCGVSFLQGNPDPLLDNSPSRYAVEGDDITLNEVNMEPFGSSIKESAPQEPIDILPTLPTTDSRTIFSAPSMIMKTVGKIRGSEFPLPKAKRTAQSLKVSGIPTKPNSFRSMKSKARNASLKKSGLSIDLSTVNIISSQAVAAGLKQPQGK